MKWLKSIPWETLWLVGFTLFVGAVCVGAFGSIVWYISRMK